MTIIAMGSLAAVLKCHPMSSFAHRLPRLQPCARMHALSLAHEHMSTLACATQKGFPCKETVAAPRSTSGVRVALCGAAGNMGKFLALQLKMSPLIQRINLFDLEDTFGIACDLNHINTRCKIKSFQGPTALKPALQEMDIVLIVAGRSWRRGMTSEDLFNLNAGTVRTLAEATAFFCPEAIVGVVTAPINSFVPLVNEVYKQAKQYNPDKIIGMATHHVMLANSIVAMTHYLDASTVHIPVIGGVSDVTVVPLWSLARPYSDFSQEEVVSLTKRIRECETTITELRGCRPGVSGGYATARFALTLVRGICGEPDAIMSAYVRSNVLPHCKYFANQLLFGPGGVTKNFGIPKISRYETAVLEQVVPNILEDIQRAEKYMSENVAIVECDSMRPECPKTQVLMTDPNLV